MDEKTRKIELCGQTFIIDIKGSQNKTWQGTILWVQRQKKESFRSTLELIRLLDSAIGLVEKEKV